MCRAALAPVHHAASSATARPWRKLTAQKRAIVPVRKGDNLHRSVDRKQSADEDGGGGYPQSSIPTAIRTPRRYQTSASYR
jgi:hypothetical protein